MPPRARRSPRVAGRFADARPPLRVGERGLAERQRALDDVAQLADVAGPVVALELLEQRGRLREAAAAHLARRTMRTSERDVLLALAQRRHLRATTASR